MLDSPKSLERICDEYVLDMLTKCNGNRTRASKFLGIAVKTLRLRISRMRKRGYEIEKKTAPVKKKIEKEISDSSIGV